MQFFGEVFPKNFPELNQNTFTHRSPCNGLPVRLLFLPYRIDKVLKYRKQASRHGPDDPRNVPSKGPKADTEVNRGKETPVSGIDRFVFTCFLLVLLAKLTRLQ